MYKANSIVFSLFHTKRSFFSIYLTGDETGPDTPLVLGDRQITLFTSRPAMKRFSLEEYHAEPVYDSNIEFWLAPADIITSLNAGRHGTYILESLKVLRDYFVAALAPGSTLPSRHLTGLDEYMEHLREHHINFSVYTKSNPECIPFLTRFVYSAIGAIMTNAVLDPEGTVQPLPRPGERPPGPK